MLTTIVGPITGMVVGALLIGVIAMFYVLSENKEHEREIDDLRRQLKALQTPEFLTSLTLPDMSERAKIRSDAEVRLIKECEGTIILGIRQALTEGKDYIVLNLGRFPTKVRVSAMKILERDGDYLVTSSTSDAYRITWEYGM